MRSSHSAVLSATFIGAVLVAACSTDTGVATTSTTTVAVPATATTIGAAPSTTETPPPTVAPDATEVTVGEKGPAARLDPASAITLDAAGFADRLSASHSTIVDPFVEDGDRARAGVEHQLLLRELAARPDLDDAVLVAVDSAARPSLERTIRARQFLQQRSADRPPRPPVDELPGWTIVDPEPVNTLRAYYADAEELTGIAWYWLAAIHLQETRMGRIRGVSTAGAVGPMQFLPTTWEVCCTGDPTATPDAIIGAATYLAQSGGPDDMAAAIYEYNPNDGYVAVVTAYAENLRDEPELYPGYHAFQVFFGTSAGTVRLPVGYSESAPIDAAAHLAEHPGDAA